MPKRNGPTAALRNKPPEITDERGVRRFIALAFEFYKHCENRHCRRAGQCCGENAACFDAFWWKLPEYQKVWFREIIKARCAGATIAESEAAGLAAAKEQLEMEAKWSANPRVPPRAGAVSIQEPPKEPANESTVAPPRVELQAWDESQSGPNRRGPRLTAVTPRIAYKSVVFS